MDWNTGWTKGKLVLLPGQSSGTWYLIVLESSGGLVIVE